MGFICSFLPGLLDFSISNLHLYVSYETNVILHSQTRRPGALFLLLYNNTPTQHTGTFLTIGLFRTCLNKPGITLSVLGKSIKKHCEKMETHNYMIFAGCHINMNAGQLVALFLIALLDRPSSYFAVLWVEILVSSGYVLCFSATLDLQNSRSFSTLSLTLIPELLHRIYQNRDLCFLPWWYNTFTENYSQEKARWQFQQETNKNELFSLSIQSYFVALISSPCSSR